MPPRCCEPDYDALFDDRAARRELAEYRRNGPSGSTRRLIERIVLEGVEGASVLDVGGGVGVIGAELLGAGASSLTAVDASRAYGATAQAELERRGFGDRVTVRHGDFVRIAAEIAPADIVTLDRVVCCYGDWEALIGRSSERAHRLIGLVFPNDRWWMRLVVGTGNLVMRVLRQQFRFYIHPEREIDARIRAAGFERRFHHRSIGWQTVLYRRELGGAPTYHNKSVYHSGWHLASRDRRAVESHTTHGHQVVERMWPIQEMAVLERAWAAGASVPYPVERTDDGVVMEFIGAGQQAAPRLAQARLSTTEVASAWQQLRTSLRALTSAGLVHADLSAYNLLWWHGRLVVIDLPQAVEFSTNTDAPSLLHRELENVATWFARLGLTVDIETEFADLLGLVW